MGLRRVDILAIGVHPDDIELGCSGTLLAHREKGHSIGLLDLTRGELGSRGNAKIRTDEAMTAASILDAEFRIQLKMPDGFFEQNKENLVEIIKVIRRTQPEIVLANAPADRHPDHGRAAKLVADACFLSGLIKIKTTAGQKSQSPWRPKHVYHYIQDYYLQPDFVFDISQVMEKKTELIMAFKSQFYDPESKEPQTPISSKDFLEFVKARARNFGRPAGFTFAEGFVTNRYIGVKDMFDLY